VPFQNFAFEFYTRIDFDQFQDVPENFYSNATG
jgi:hypothetical protein